MNKEKHIFEMTFTLNDVEKVAQRLASVLPNSRVVTFTGLLGAGKTTLVKALLKECGVREVATSPTFTYVNLYKNDNGHMFYHFDLYRIKTVDDFIQAGFAEYLYQPESWCFIEWPEHIMVLVDKNACHVKIDYIEEELRHITVSVV